MLHVIHLHSTLLCNYFVAILYIPCYKMYCMCDVQQEVEAREETRILRDFYPHIGWTNI